MSNQGRPKLRFTVVVIEEKHEIACAASGIVYCVIKVLAAEPRSKKKGVGKRRFISFLCIKYPVFL